MMLKRKFMILSSVIALVAMVATIAVYAWFYYPAQTPIVIDTSDELPIEINMYKYSAEYNSEHDVYLYEWSQIEVDDGALKINPNVTFFQWGDEYMAENFYAQYYVMECILETDLYNSGAFRVDLDVVFDCENAYTRDQSSGSTTEFKYNYIDNGTTSTTNVPLRLPSVMLEYYLVPDANIIIENDEAFISTLTGAEYLDFEYEGEETFSTPLLEFRASYSKSFKEESTTEFVKDDQLRLVFFFKVDDNSDELNEYMKHIDDIGEVDVLFNNIINLSVKMRSIPKKETE